MRSLLLSRADLDFLLHDWLGVESLTTRERFAEHGRETFDAALVSPSRLDAWAGEEYVAPKANALIYAPPAREAQAQLR